MVTQNPTRPVRLRYPFTVYAPSIPEQPFDADMRNKFSHTLTLLFLCTYIDQWTSFFADIFTLIRPAESPSSSQPTYNRHVSLLFFHLVLEISGEVADQMIKAARTFTQARHVRDARVRDAMRERDAASINEAVLTIVADGAEKMASLRKADPTPEATRELDDVTEVVDWGIRTFGSYVGMTLLAFHFVILLI
jgi:exportin-T